ncbi:hypothetical protein [Alteromonas lipolytica]|uniref:Outer membrane protein beta-barrel domain-containing protein n=1 Tax=Alteromonas lipolytica TaxID=1856405 RepID=A0A1E8FDI7_9ALTE|nr:hypothetical protein [Alteromonas lipolytica]OFI33826.1 hypothetical protein BFC17_19855 [Alteromonas lipolytica]GGF68046.1 hypothetical protein GCM10011338_20320 [Alteromonas lipolytica]
MIRQTLRLTLLGLVVMFSCPLLANQPPMLPDSPLVSTPVANTQYFIEYQSKRLPEWNFSMEINRSYAERFGYDNRRVPVTLIGLEAVSVSARRALPVESTQWIYATFRSTQYWLTPQASMMPLAGDSDRAASVGWQFGELRGFNIAVGYEYRDVGETDLNSLVMGVHYYF